MTREQALVNKTESRRPPPLKALRTTTGKIGSSQRIRTWDTGQMGIRWAAAFVAAGVLIGVVAVSALGGDPDDDTVSVEVAAGERGAPGHGIVFYSGENEAGVAEADQYSDWEYVEDNQPLGITYSDWAEGGCSPDAAATHPSDRNLHVLVGYSIGRLGPIYFLRHRSRWNEIDTIWLLDPGPKGEMLPPSCDGKLAPTRRPGQDLAEWLAGGTNRRVIVISAYSTNSDGRDGLEQYYLNDIRQMPPDIANRAFLCVDGSTGHGQAPRVYMPLVHGTTSCPAPARGNGSGPLSGTLAPTTAPPATSPPATSPLATSPPATSPPATSPPATSPLATGPAATSPPATSPPATSPPATSAPATSPPATSPPARTITVYNMVTNGGTQMREDTPAYLSKVTQNYCKSNGCALSGTDMKTGAQITAVCHAQGARTTNGEDHRSIDDANPGLYQSTLWYGIRWGDGRFGYISEVWINSAHRGGLGLPGC